MGTVTGVPGVCRSIGTSGVRSLKAFGKAPFRDWSIKLWIREEWDQIHARGYCQNPTHSTLSCIRCQSDLCNMSKLNQFDYQNSWSMSPHAYVVTPSCTLLGVPGYIKLIRVTGTTREIDGAPEDTGEETSGGCLSSVWWVPATILNHWHGRLACEDWAGWIVLPADFDDPLHLCCVMLKVELTVCWSSGKVISL